MEARLTILVHPKMVTLLSSVVHMLSDGLAELGIEPDVVEALQGEAPRRAIVLGANLYSPSQLQLLDRDSIILNVENSASSFMTHEYRGILRKFNVWDYSQTNASLISEMIGRPVFYLKMFYVGRLSRIVSQCVQNIDVLFYGSFNERRSRVIDSLRSRGLTVSAVFGVYGPELDYLIERAKVVINIHYYENGGSEMLRISDLLANSRAVVTELNPGEFLDADLVDALVTAPYECLADATEALVQDPDRRRGVERAGFQAFSRRHAGDILLEALAWADFPKPPSDAMIGSGKMYDPRLFNIDSDARWNPDIVADVADRTLFDREYQSARFGTVRLRRGGFDSITASHVLEHIPDLTTAMTNCLELLAIGGVLRITVPYDLSYGAWQDPTHVRAFNERSWLYYCEWYWYLNWGESRFDLVEISFWYSPVGNSLAEQGVHPDEIMRTPRAVDEMSVVLRKRPLDKVELAYGKEMRGDSRVQAELDRRSKS